MILFLFDQGALEEVDERCLSISSPEMRRSVDAAPAFVREVVLAPKTLVGRDAAALASALHADAVRDGAKWRLFRSEATAASLKAEDLTWMRGRMEDAIARAEIQFRAPGSVTAPLDALKAAQSRFQSRKSDDVLDTAGVEANRNAPVSRLLTEVMKGIPPSALDRAAPGVATVFSNLSVGSEYLLRVSTPSLEAYSKAQSRFARWYVDEGGASAVPEAYRWAFPKGDFLPGERTIQVHIDRNETTPSVGLQVFDPSGRREAGASVVLEESVDSGLSFLGPGTKALGKLPFSQTEIVTPSTSSAEPATTAIDPVASDPLDGVVRRAILLWSKAKGYGRVVACVPDDLLESTIPCVAHGELDLDMFTRALARSGCESFALDGTMIVRPRHALQEEATRVDRRPLSLLLKRASTGSFGLEDLFRYHASYRESYERRRALQRMERPILNAYPWLRDPNWNLPHPLLAILGMLGPTDRQALASGRRVSLASDAFIPCLRALVRYSVPAASSYVAANGSSFTLPPPTAQVSGSDLGRTPTRVIASAVGPFIEGASSQRVLVRRVSKGRIKVIHIDPATRKESIEEGVNVVLDPDPIPLSSAGTSLPGEATRQDIDRAYRFFWRTERLTRIVVSLGDRASAGPFTVSERGAESKSAVSLDDILGS